MRGNSVLFEKDLLVTPRPGFFWISGFLLLTVLSAFKLQIAQPNLVSTGYCTKGVSVNAFCPDILKETPTSFSDSNGK